MKEIDSGVVALEFPEGWSGHCGGGRGGDAFVGGVNWRTCVAWLGLVRWSAVRLPMAAPQGHDLFQGMGPPREDYCPSHSVFSPKAWDICPRESCSPS